MEVSIIFFIDASESPCEYIDFEGKEAISEILDGGPTSLSLSPPQPGKPEEAAS